MIDEAFRELRALRRKLLKAAAPRWLAREIYREHLELIKDPKYKQHFLRLALDRVINEQDLEEERRKYDEAPARIVTEEFDGPNTGAVTRYINPVTDTEIVALSVNPRKPLALNKFLYAHERTHLKTGMRDEVSDETLAVLKDLERLKAVLTMDKKLKPYYCLHALQYISSYFKWQKILYKYNRSKIRLENLRRKRPEVLKNAIRYAITHVYLPLYVWKTGLTMENLERGLEYTRSYLLKRYPNIAPEVEEIIRGLKRELNTPA